MIKKRVLALALVLCMAVGLLPATALAADGSTPTPVPITPDSAWYTDAIAADPNEDEFTIDTVEELAGLAQLVKDGNTFAGKTVKIGADITFAPDQYWYYNDGNGTVLDYRIMNFAGAFDGTKAEGGEGATYTITGLKFCKMQNAAFNLGLFESITADGSVKGLTLKNVSATTAGGWGRQTRIGPIAYSLAGKAENCHVDGVTYTVNGYLDHSGGMFGTIGNNATVTKSTAKNIRITINSDDNGQHVGGFAGNISSSTDKNTGITGKTSVTDCSVEDVFFDCTYKLKRFGGFVGYANNTTLANCTATNVNFEVDDWIYQVGGFVGMANVNSTFTNCDINANGEGKGVTMDLTRATAGATRVGGFAGTIEGATVDKPATFTLCDVTGLNITMHGKLQSSVGGFLGHSKGVANIEKCTVIGKIDATDTQKEDSLPVGGFIGTADQPATIKNSSADVDIRTTAVAGGFAGDASNLTIEGSSSAGDVVSTNGAAGGFAGTGGSASMTGCTAAGNVTSSAGSAGGFWGEITADDITITGCGASGTVSGVTESDFIGKVQEGVDVDRIGYAVNLTLWGNHGGTCAHTTTAAVTYEETYNLKTLTYGNGETSVYPPVYSDSYQHKGYVLQGWYTAKTGGVKVINADGTLAANVAGYTNENGGWIGGTSAALYAQWQAKTTAITLDAGGGTGGTAAVPATYDQMMPAFTPPTKLHEGTGKPCHLTGWYTLPDGGGCKVLNYDGTLLADVPGYSNSAGKWINESAGVTLYAHWNHDDTPYTVSIYKLNLDTVTYEVEKHAYTGYVDEPVSYTPPAYTGFTFDAENPNNVLSATVRGDGSLELKLYYKRNSYPVILGISESGGVAGVSGAGEYLYGQQVVISMDLLPGYEFYHWDLRAGEASDLSTQTASFVMPAQAVGLQAHAGLIDYTITYELDGGANAVANPGTYTVLDAVTLAAPAKAGYTFGGWYTNAGFSGAAVSDIPAGSTGNIVLYAKWDVIWYGPTDPVFPPPYIPPVTPADPVKPVEPENPAKPAEKPVVNPGKHPFTDVPDGEWYSDGVQYVYTYGMMNGVNAAGTLFDLYGSTTRAMLMTVLARLDGVDTSTGTTWDEVGTKWAVENGISDGTNGERSISREELVTMLWRYAGEPHVDVFELSQLSTWPDGTGVSSWAQKPMAWALKHGIINGVDGKLAPDASASRAMVATMLMRFCELSKR